MMSQPGLELQAPDPDSDHFSPRALGERDWKSQVNVRTENLATCRDKEATGQVGCSTSSSCGQGRGTILGPLLVQKRQSLKSKPGAIRDGGCWAEG